MSRQLTPEAWTAETFGVVIQRSQSSRHLCRKEMLLTQFLRVTNCPKWPWCKPITSKLPTIRPERGCELSSLIIRV
jgi:hypothetical protein